MAVLYHEGRFPPATLDWPRLIPLLGPAAAAGIPTPTARRFLSVLRDGGVLTPLAAGRGRRAAVLAFPASLNIAEGREVL